MQFTLLFVLGDSVFDFLDFRRICLKVKYTIWIYLLSVKVNHYAIA